MTIFFSWRDNKSTDGIADIANWKVRKFTYTWKGSSSEKAFWVFEATSSYKPDKNITKDRALIVFDFADMGDSVIKNSRKSDLVGGLNVCWGSQASKYGSSGRTTKQVPMASARTYALF
jgi:hypothetical protein